MNILITGATGFVGEELRPFLLKDGHNLVIVTRNPKKHEDEAARNQQFISWEGDLIKAMNECDAVIHLAGENLFGKRWTDEVKKKILNSRVQTTNQLVEAMQTAEKHPEVFICASGSSIYGEKGDNILDENAPVADTFLADVCKKWEMAADRASQFGVRVVQTRFGIILEKGGGALKLMVPPYHFFVGGPIGRGSQYLSWIHREDVCRVMDFIIQNKNISGPCNVASPEPETMDEFAGEIGETLNRPSLFRVPEFGLKLVLGEAASPVLESIRLKPEKLLKNGFQFKYEELEEALADVL